MENLDPPPPQIKDGKMARFCSSRAFILDLGGGGVWGFAVPFYFVQDCRYQNPKKWPKKSIRKFSKKMFINPNFISKNLEIYSRNPDLSQLHIICIKCWIFVTCAI